MKSSLFGLQLREPERHPAEDAFALAGGVLLGAALGAVAAFLLTPTDGQSLRRKLAVRLGLNSPHAHTVGQGSPYSGHSGERHTPEPATDVRLDELPKSAGDDPRAPVTSPTVEPARLVASNS